MANPFEITSPMKLVNCQCGTIYGVANWVTQYTCPICANRQIREANESFNEALADCAARDRTIRSLKGALTKAKRREGAKRCCT